MSYIGSKPADAVLETNDIADGVVTNPKLSTGSQQNFRNIIINGDMSIAQRGTSSSGVTSNGYYTVDRWLMNIGSSGTWTQSQSTDVPTNQGFASSLKLDCTTANASLSGSANFSFQQRFEGQNLQYLKFGTANAQSLTLSFWVKTNKTGTYIVEIRDGSFSRSVSKSYTVNVSNTWEKKTITFPGDTINAIVNDNTGALVLAMWLSAGTNFTSGTLNTSWNTRVQTNTAVGQVNLADSTANEWYITGVQLEAGTTASDYEFLPVDVNLIRCKRYFQVIGTDGGGNGANAFIGTYNTTVQILAWRFFPVRMRAGPSQTFSALSTWDIEPFDVSPTALSSFHSSPEQICLSATDPSARVRGYGAGICMDTAGGYIQMSSEL